MITQTYTNAMGEFPCVFTKLKPSKSLIVMMYMGKMLGGTAGKAINSLQGSSLGSLSEMSDEDVNFEKIGDIVSSFFDKLEDEEFLKKLAILFESVQVNGESLYIDHPMFEEDPTLIFKVAVKAIGVNYKSFLGKSSGVIEKLKGLVKTAPVSNDSQTEPK
jgi:hypothetical protein